MYSRKKVSILLLCLLMLAYLFAGCQKDGETQKNSTEERAKLTFCMSQTGWGGEAVDPELMKEVENILRKRQMSKKIIICLMLSFQPFNIHY